MGTAARILMPTEPIQPDALLTLAQWFSPTYPLGSYSYSHGLEWAVQNGDVVDAATLHDWISAILQHGAGRTDAIFLVSAYRESCVENLSELDDLARAMAPSKERLLETDQQGSAFSTTTASISGEHLAEYTFPVGVGHAARLFELPLEQTLLLYLQAFASNLVSAGVRLVPLGQTEGQKCLSRFAPICQRLAQGALTLTLDDLGSSTIAADIASMKHETQYTRLFRS